MKEMIKQGKARQLHFGNAKQLRVKMKIKKTSYDNIEVTENEKKLQYVY